MNDFVTSLIRTNVPIAVGAFVTWLVSLGVVVPEGAEVPLAVSSVAFVTAGYYAAVRWAETKWPPIGWLLGSRAEPQYRRAGDDDADVDDAPEV